MTLQTFAGLVFFSTALWSGLAPNVFVWSFLECAGGILLVRRLLKEEDWVLPELSVTLPWGALALWSALSFFWTSNFHSTLTSLYKIFFLTSLLVLFMNERAEWEKGFRLSVKITGTLCALLWICFPASARAAIPYPNLSSGFLALAAVMTFEGYSYILMSLAIFLTSSLGPILAWTGGSLLQAKVQRFNKPLIAVFLFFAISFIPVRSNPLHQVWTRKFDDRHTLERIQMWKDSWNMFMARPLRGVGLGNFREVYPEHKSLQGLRTVPYAHNEILNFLCEMGAVGAIILGVLLWGIISKNPQIMKNSNTALVPVLAAAGIQSLFDFNLRHPPIIILFTFCLSALMPMRDCVQPSKILRRSLAALTMLLTLFCALPGASALFFGLNPKNLGWAMALDPFNAFYYSQSGRMRDLEIAISLEPRNVWFRRKAADFHLADWQKFGNPASLESAQNEYETILKLAPNVPEFNDEYKKIFYH